jgi:hypothetical protein
LPLKILWESQTNRQQTNLSFVVIVLYFNNNYYYHFNNNNNNNQTNTPQNK